MGRAIAAAMLIACLVACSHKTIRKMDTGNIFEKGQPLPATWFTGNAFITPLVARDTNHNFSAGSVTFDPGARTHWHTHPKGQVLLIIEGAGFYQEKGKPALPVKKGDVVNIPAHTVHWHGAAAATSLVHIAITNYEEDVQVVWLQPVTDEEYRNAHPQ